MLSPSLKDLPINFLRFGMQRKKDLMKDMRPFYNGLVLPGNILLYQKKSTCALVYRCTCPYFIDPMTYLFGQPFEEFKRLVKKKGPGFKPSFEKLLTGHGLDPNEFINRDHGYLVNKLATDSTTRRIFIETCLAFQLSTVSEGLRAANDLLEEGDALEEGDDAYQPAIIIPPYFLFSNYGLNLTSLNWQIWEHCDGLMDKRLFPMIFLQKEDLVGPLADEIIARFNDHSFAGSVIWIEDFDERQATPEQVAGLKKLVIGVTVNGQEAMLLYGGFYCMLLHPKLTGVCHGMAYGESRTIDQSVQKGSGPAPVRYYLPRLHSFLTLANAAFVLQQMPHLMCDCAVCRRVMAGDPKKVADFQDQEDLAEIHFIINRKKERSLINSASEDDLFSMLRNDARICEQVADLSRLRGPGDSKRPIIDRYFISRWIVGLRS